MGIRFRCHHCETELHVKDFQGGKRGRCPECKGKFRIPPSDTEHSLPADDLANDAGEESGAGAAPTQVAQEQPSVQPDQRPASQGTPYPQALATAPNARWYVLPTAGGQYGPADSQALWQWLQENRIGPDALVWCEGWPEWQVSGRVFGDFFSIQVAARLSPGEIAGANTGDQPQVSPGQKAVGSGDPDTAVAKGGKATDSSALPLSERNRVSRKQRRKRNYAVLMAVLSVTMIALVVALVVVLNSQSE